MNRPPAVAGGFWFAREIRSLHATAEGWTCPSEPTATGCRALAEAAEEPFDTDEYSEEIFEDFDVEILLNLSLDGIEHDTLISAAMGFDLRFESWFNPGPNRLVCMEKRQMDDRNIGTSG